MMRKSIHTRDYSLFLELLIEARRKSGLTQAELGASLPFEQPAISKIERGERRVDIIELKLICDALGISIIDFISNLEKKLTE